MSRGLNIIIILVALGIAFADLLGAVADARAVTVMPEPVAISILTEHSRHDDGPCAMCPDGGILCHLNTCRISNASSPMLIAPDARLAAPLFAYDERLTGLNPALDPPPPEV